MAIKMKAVSKINPQNRQAPPKYYGAAQPEKTVTLRQLARGVAEKSNASLTESENSIKLLIDAMKQEFSSGNNIKLSGLGIFSLNVKTEAVEKESDVSVNGIKEVKVNFRPDKEIKDFLGNVKVEKV